MSPVPVSSVPQVLAYLKTKIEAQLASTTSTSTLREGTYVFAGDPTSPNLPADFISIGRVVRTPSRAAMVGSGGFGFLEEHYDVTVTVSVWRGGQTEPWVTERAWTLLGYVEIAVRSTPGLGGLVDEAYPSRSSTPGPVFTGEPVGPQVTITETIHCDRLA